MSNLAQLELDLINAVGAAETSAALEEVRAAGVAGVTGHHVLDRYAADGIIDTAVACGSDLLVISSHGRRGMSRVLLGSQTTEVLARSTMPVLVIR